MSVVETYEDRERAAIEAGDCRLWEPKDALRAVLRDILAGKIDPDLVYIGLRVPAEAEYTFYIAGGHQSEVVEMLTQHLKKLCGGAQ